VPVTGDRGSENKTQTGGRGIAVEQQIALHISCCTVRNVIHAPHGKS